MTQEAPRKRTGLTGKARILTTSSSSWHWITLAAILVLSAFLNLFRITQEDYGSDYYAAGVKSMLTSWSNFFFASFDAGFISIDKPPLGLWIQAASAWLFGFSGLSLLLPQAIAGVLSVAVLYYLVRRTFGPVAGLLAALALAVTPIGVAVQRNNVMDALLILALLLAAWAFVVAAAHLRAMLAAQAPSRAKMALHSSEPSITLFGVKELAALPRLPHPQLLFDRRVYKEPEETPITKQAPVVVLEPFVLRLLSWIEGW